MSNIYRFAENIAYYQMPQALIERLTFLRLDELKLLNFLHSEFQRTSKNRIELQADVIGRQTGIHPTNLAKARKSLVSEGLLIARKSGQCYAYSCCNPTDRTAVPDGAQDSVKLNFDDATPQVLQAYFKPHLKNVKTTPNGLSGRCPFQNHTDDTASFSVDLRAGNGGRWNCFGCSKAGKLVDLEVELSKNANRRPIDRVEAHKRVEAKLRNLGMKKGRVEHPNDVVYPYCDEEGVLISETVRPEGDKSHMFQRRPHPDKPGEYLSDTKGCRRVLYRLPEVLGADTVIVVEGEPDVESIRELNLIDTGYRDVAATTIANGVGRWLPKYTSWLKGKRVILLGDTDEPGQRYMELVETALRGDAKELLRINLPREYRDISHWLQGRCKQDLINLVGEQWLSKRPEI